MTAEGKRRLEEIGLAVAFAALILWVLYSVRSSPSIGALATPAAPSVTLGGDTIDNGGVTIGGNAGNTYYLGSDAAGLGSLPDPSIASAAAPYRIIGPPSSAAGGLSDGCGCTPACSIGSVPTTATLQSTGAAFQAAMTAAINNAQGPVAVPGDLGGVVTNWAAYDPSDGEGAIE